jgi:hypothetical protein
MHHDISCRSARILSHLVSACLALFVLCSAALAEAPTPLLKKGESAKWWFVFKFNATSFPGCAGDARPACLFGGKVQKYSRFSQQFVYASDKSPNLQHKGSGCLGDSVDDPVGATFEQVFNGDFFYVIWNDQFYLDPKLDCARGNSCSDPWAHAKGMVAWDHNGAGFVMQVTTPNWPGYGTPEPARERGNTLGCLTQIKGSKVSAQNNVMYSQHFFALQLNKDDMQIVLKALKHAAVVTDPDDARIVKKGGPPEIVQLVEALGETSGDRKVMKSQLSTGVTLIAKPSDLLVPPWQMVSAVLGGPALRVATWWTRNRIPSTKSSPDIECWDETVLGSMKKIGLVEIAKSGQWNKTVFGLKGGENHAKIGVAKSDEVPLSIFGDMNQEGALDGECATSQNKRGGLFFVVENDTLAKNIRLLLRGATAGTTLDDDADEEEEN